MDHQIELGTETLHGGISNNPLYQLAEEHNLIDIDDSKIAQKKIDSLTRLLSPIIFSSKKKGIIKNMII